jgi:hypothetical protein
MIKGGRRLLKTEITLGSRAVALERAGLLLLAVITASALPVVGSAETFLAETRSVFTTAEGLPSNDVRSVALRGGRLFAFTAEGSAVFSDGRFALATAVAQEGDVAVASDGREARAAKDGLFLREKGGEWKPLRRATAHAAGRRSTCAAWPSTRRAGSGSRARKASALSRTGASGSTRRPMDCRTTTFTSVAAGERRRLVRHAQRSHPLRRTRVGVPPGPPLAAARRRSRDSGGGERHRLVRDAGGSAGSSASR